MTETIIVYVFIAVALLLAARWIWCALSGKTSSIRCGCGQNGCAMKDQCASPQQTQDTPRSARP